jgi:hypothetical protein
MSPFLFSCQFMSVNLLIYSSLLKQANSEGSVVVDVKAVHCRWYKSRV